MSNTNHDEAPQSLYQKRKKIHPRKVSGFYQKLRAVTITITLGWFFVAPWLTIYGRQAILFDLPNRKFYIWWLTFWPQDFILLAWLLIIAAITLLFVTMLAGRLWCGYTCPQTVWTKLFISIERFCEGSRIQRIKLDKSPWSTQKIIKRYSKHLLWLMLSLLTALTFVGFFTPIRLLFSELIHFQLGTWEFFWIAFFTIATYINAGWMREQVCTYMCPYARFQSAMLDKDTLVISYDPVRGEPRGSRKRNIEYHAQGLGDCIDCSQCVQVCPTGIDIRNGLQMECIGCAACIDICNDVMDTMNYPRGLIRYSTEHLLQQKKIRLLRPRLIATGGVLLILVIGLLLAFSHRVPLRLDILKDRVQLYRVTGDGQIENSYLLKIINMNQEPHTYDISVSGLNGIQYIGKKKVTIEGNQLLSLPVSLRVAPHNITDSVITLIFTVTDVEDPHINVSSENRFIGPR